MSDSGGLPDDVAADIEKYLLGSKRSLTRGEVADKAGMSLELAEELWAQLGFPRTTDDDVAFTKLDVRALKLAGDLINAGILEADSQAALVRTWGRSFARLAEWQTTLLAGVALEGEDPMKRLDELLTSVLPKVEELQDYVWRRHLASAAHRLLGSLEGATESRMAVAFVDIVGYTSRSKTLSDHELVDWIEEFEDETTRLVVAAGGRVIKTIGDEVLYVNEDLPAAVEVALALTARGEADDDFPQVRAGIAWGNVVNRLGDVYGPTVNIASRLTDIARPDTVLIDRGAFEFLTDQEEPATAPDGTPLAKLIDRATEEIADLSPYAEHGEYKFRRLRRQAVKGYRHLEPWVVRHGRTKDAD